MTPSRTDLEWRAPSNMRSGIKQNEPARVRWPHSAERPLKDHEVPWKYGHLVWDEYTVHPRPGVTESRRGQVFFEYKGGRMEIMSKIQVQVQRPQKGGQR